MGLKKKKRKEKEKGSQFVEVVRKQDVASVKCKHLVSAGCTKKKKKKAIECLSFQRHTLFSFFFVLF